MRIGAEIAFDFEVTLHHTEDKINCDICFEDTFTYYDLECGHTYCSWCIAKHTHITSHRGPPICPTCRGPMTLEEKNCLLAYYYRVTDFSKRRRSSRASRAPLRFSTDGVHWCEY